jgi:hypothetical protein
MVTPQLCLLTCRPPARTRLAAGFVNGRADCSTMAAAAERLFHSLTIFVQVALATGPFVGQTVAKFI